MPRSGLETTTVARAMTAPDVSFTVPLTELVCAQEKLTEITLPILERRSSDSVLTTREIEIVILIRRGLRIEKSAKCWDFRAGHKKQTRQEHRQRSLSGDESTEGAISSLGNFLCRDVYATMTTYSKKGCLL
jgi:hypothetical protein